MLISQDTNQEIIFFNKLSEKYFIVEDNRAAKLVVDRIKQLNIPGRFILDCGCGVGHQSAFILKIFPDTFITGVDVSYRNIQYSRLLCGNSRFKGIVGDLKDQKCICYGDYDIALCLGILHHFKTFDLIAFNLKCWVKKDGYLIIYEPNGDHPIAKLMHFVRRSVQWLMGDVYIINKGWATPNETNHTRREYIKSFSINNFKLIHQEQVFFNYKSKGIWGLIPLANLILRRIFPTSWFSANGILLIFKKGE